MAARAARGSWYLPSMEPEPAPWFAGLSRETTLYRDAEGRWFFDDEPVAHPNLSRAFDGWIGRGDDGRYCLRNSINWAYVRIDGPPYFVRAVQLLPDGGIGLSLSGDRESRLDPATLCQDAAGALYCRVFEEALIARFDSHAAAQLGPRLHEDGAGVYLDIDGKQVRPPLVDDPLRLG